MSHTSVPVTVRYALWGKAGGRCQYRGCNKPLWKDPLTQREFNNAYLAHIVADTPGGPRGDQVLSPQLAAELSNVMLLCDSHHRLIDLEDVLVTPAGKRRQVRVIVDGDGGVSLDDVAVVSQRVSAALDDSAAMGSGPYVLEVTSPGVDRPLTQPRHWRRASGRLVRATLAGGEEVTGRVIAVDDEAVVLDAGEGERRLGHDELVRGLVQVEFNRKGADAPGGDED